MGDPADQKLWVDTALGEKRGKPNSWDHALWEVGLERAAQDRKWGPQQDRQEILPDVFPSTDYWISRSEYYKTICNSRFDAGIGSFTDILLEEVAEAIDEARDGNKDLLRKELIQVAAVAVKWVEKLDQEMLDGV